MSLEVRNLKQVSKQALGQALLSLRGHVCSWFTDPYDLSCHYHPPMTLTSPPLKRIYYSRPLSVLQVWSSAGA